MAKHQYSHEILRNKLALSMLADERARGLISDFVTNSSDAIFDNYAMEIFRSKRIRKLVPSFYTTISDISHSGRYHEIGQIRLFSLFLIYIKSQKEKLLSFVSLRDEIEQSIILANYEKANSLVNKAEEILGESIWLSRTKMLVLSGLGDSVAFEAYCKLCEKNSVGSFNSFVFKCMQVVADSGNASFQLGGLVGRNVKELREAQNGSIASFLEVLFYPHPLEPIAEPMDCLIYLQAYPVVDQYTIILTALRYELTRIEAENEENTSVLTFARRIFEIIPDRAGLNISKLNTVVQAGPTKFSGPALALYDCYSSGDYKGAINEFERCQGLVENSLALVNLAGKAMAYANVESTLDSRSPPIMSIANSLATIHRLSPLWVQAEEQLVSLCIKYNHFSHSAHIQLAMFKSLPFKYSIELQRIAARMAISTTSICTPQTFSMAGLSSIYQDGIDIGLNPPVYRYLKNQVLCETSKDIIDKNKVEALLEQLSSTKILTKDLLECRSRYYLSTKQDEQLFFDSASNLIIDGNRFICYPMDYMFKEIEDRQLHDLNSIIIVYHYNKSVSDERDYVLNEALHEYLIKKNCSRPSELFKNKAELSDEEKVFFRDVCIPDVMDCLDCFKNSNELRSERILLLDGLESRGVIDAKVRMREVEDIVRQVIVDAGTSELNGAKIFVNDSVIRKKHEDEVASLLSLYRKIPTGSDERYTNIDSENSKGGYISGSRNSLIERLFSMLSNSFIFDDKYGLDKNLSAEIRHGFFSNLMRARLEEWHLLTELDDKGDYLSNSYWREKNDLLVESFWNSIDELLKEFSRNFDDAISEAEEWMKISISPDDKKHIFSFELSMREFINLKYVVEVADEVDLICTFILEILWRKTEAALSEMREKLHGDFKEKIDKIFDETINKISVQKKGVALLDLMQAFTRARNDITEDINTASEWFKRNENTEITAGTLDRLIEIAVRSFEKVRGNAYIIDITNPGMISNIPVNKQVAKPFILAIINLLDNCYSHSGLGQATRVEINGHLQGALATVVIKNSLSTERQAILNEEYFKLIRAKLDTSDISKHIRGEGGTGLIKARNEINYLGKKSQLEIFKKDEQFHASITYEYGIV